MNFLSNIWLALHGINHNRVRGFLSILGVIIGVVAVIGMGSLAVSMQSAFEKQSSRMGANTFTVQRMSRIEMMMQFTSGNRQKMYELWRRPRFDLEYVDEIRESCPSVRSVAPFANTSYSFRRGRKRSREQIEIINTNEDFLQGGIYKLAEGRFLTEYDVLRRRYVCVIGQQVARDFFGGENPIGKDINTGDVKMKVIGVLEEVGATMGTNPDNVAIIPITTGIKFWPWLKWRMDINIEAEPGKTGAAEDEVITTLRRLRGLRAGDDNNFSIVTSEMMQETLGKITGAAALVVLLIAGVSLVVAGIGIMNVMFVSVRERTREIGIRKACGASSHSILIQFALEAVFLSTLGGAIGLALVWGIASLVGSVPVPGEEGGSMDLIIPPMLIVIGLVFSFMVGVVFGIIPAYRAGKLKVVDALRYE